MASTILLLNELLAMHSYSLPSYLVSARPWSSRNQGTKAADALKLVATDHQRMTDRIGSLILEMGGSVIKGEYPMLFTDMHDLSTDYILCEVRRLLQLDVERMAEIAEQLLSEPKPHAVAKEAVGAGKGHLQNLDELMSSLSA